MNGEATVGNMWAMKTVLRIFELASRLSINFAKIILIGVNVSDDFLALGSMFLGCQHRSISLGGRIVLVNLVLSSIPIFYLSFKKMLVKV